jgi:hypothetical protein
LNAEILLIDVHINILMYENELVVNDE